MRVDGDSRPVEPRGWQAEPSGTRFAEKGRFRLVVLAPGVDRLVRFLVLRRPRDRGRYPYAVIASGTEDDLPAAIAAAERMADRLIGCVEPPAQVPRPSY